MLIQIQRPPRTALLLQLDGTLPNLALMRLAAHLRERELRRSLQENAFLYHLTGLIVRALGRCVRKRHFRENAAACGGR